MSINISKIIKIFIKKNIMLNKFYENSAYSSNISNQIGLDQSQMIFQNQYPSCLQNYSFYSPNAILNKEPFPLQTEKTRQSASKKKILMSDAKNKVFIANLNFDTSEEELRNYFSKFGNLIEVTVIKNRETRRPRGFGFLKYSDSIMVDEVLKNRPHNLGNRQLDVKRMIPKQNQNEKNSSNSEIIYISGFGSDLTEHDLRSYFLKYGNIVNINIKPPKIGMDKCYGFITFSDYDSVDKIILDHKHVIKGYNLKIQKSLKKGKENLGKINFTSNSKLEKQFRFQPYKSSSKQLNNQNLYGSYQSSETEKTNFVNLLKKAIEQGYTINQTESNFGADKIIKANYF